MRRVSLLSSFTDQIDGLVHASAQSCPVERARHRGLIAARLASSFATLAMLPPYLIYHGRPAAWEAIAFAWLMLPLGAVVVVSRTGRFAVALALCLASIVGLVITLSVSGHAQAAALSWLILIPLEAALAENGVLVVAAAAAALLAALASASAPAASASSSIAIHAMFVAAAIVYATGLAFAVRYLNGVRRVQQDLEAGRSRSIAETLDNSILTFDRSGTVLSADRGMQALVGAPSHEIVGRGLFERVNVADRPAFLKALADACDSAGPIAVTFRLRKGPEDFGTGRFEATPFGWIEMRVRHAQSAVDRPGALVAVARDVGDAKRHEHDLQAARFEAERSSAWKDRFLANVSHELRTPLNAIVGFSEMLGSPELAPRDPIKQREYAKIIQTSGEHLLAVVNSILDMSKIESGSFDIVTEPFDVAPLIDASCDIVRLRAEQNGIELVRECEPRLPELVADKRACKQILINLLSNAVKFTPQGGRVTVGARLESSGFVLFVNDTGIGIGPGDLPRLGDPFFQAHTDYDRRYEGTGLGLSVVRGLVGLHDGTISIESAPGEGTSVSIRLPRDCRQAGRASSTVARIVTAHRKPPAAPASAGPLQQTVMRIA